MTLTFLTPLMLAGAVLIAAPIILHLVMRQQPKHLLFPALRFIQQRNDANKRRLKLRHLLLLLLRCGAIVFLALAMSRPTVQSAGFLGDQEAPIAAALVFDTSPRLQYRHQNQTRLEVSQEVANRVMAKLPPESEVAVIDSKTTAPAFSIDAAVAKQKISRLAASAAARPLPEVCEDALRLVSENSKARKEVYVFTDLSRVAWSSESAARLRTKLAEKTDVACYVIDVGVDEPRNVALGDLRLAAESLAKNSPLRLETDLQAVGPVGDDQSVVLDLIDTSGQPQRRAQTAVKATADATQPVEFPEIAGLDLGTHQGIVRLVGEDSLPADDVRYLTVNVRSPWKVLVVANRPTERHAVFLKEAIAPTVFKRSGQARFDCDVASFDDLAKKSLDDYAAVCLLDPPPLNETTWQSLANFAEHGGGLGIWLGRNAQPKGRPVDDFNSPAALKVMPGKLARLWRRQDAFLAPQDYQHPLLTIFRSITSGVPWADFPVYTHWQLSDLPQGVNTVVPYSNGEAAILERDLGKGRVLVFTTPISDELTQSDGSPNPDLWNLLTVGSGAWPFMMLANGTALYLVGSGEERFNYETGETVMIPLPEEQRQLVFSLRTPEGEEFPQSVDPKTGAITITTTNTPGNYELRSGGTQGGVRRGFSVNIPAASTNLTRMSGDEFTELLGKDRFRLSRGRDEIERDVNLGRTGREMYPLLILLVAIALGLEHVLANKFYRRDPESEKPARISFAVDRAALPPKREHEPAISA